MQQFQIGIIVRNLKKQLKKTHALKGITMDFDPAVLHGIVGHDGAGKTTLLRTLMGLLRPDEGEIIFTDHGVPTPLEAIRSSIAYMPQQQCLYPDLSSSEHLDFFRDLYRIPKEIYLKRKTELLRMTRLEPFKNRRAGQLSGGMYKKLGLMCALLQSPSVILLDEPTNGIDPISRREFWDLLYRLLAEKILIIISTSYMDEAERCGKVHLADSGKILISGEPKEILRKEGMDHFGDFFVRYSRNLR